MSDKKPLYDNIIVKEHALAKQSAGGIVIPNLDPDAAIVADVLEVGQGILLANGDIKPLFLKVGDKVYIKQDSGLTMKIGDEEVRLMRECDVMGLIVEDDSHE